MTESNKELKRQLAEGHYSKLAEGIGDLFPEKPDARDFIELLYPVIFTQIIDKKKLSDEYWEKFKIETKASDKLINALKKIGLEELSEEEEAILINPK